MDWTDVEKQLVDRARDVCQHLLPDGHLEGVEWIAKNPTRGDRKEGSFKVNTRTGLWAEFAEGRGGKSLMSLWCYIRGAEFKVCIVEAKQFLGIRDDWERRYKPASAIAPSTPTDTDESAWKQVAATWKRCQPLTEGGPVWRYLVEQRRLEPAVLEIYGVREMISKNQWVMVFPYWPVPDDDAPAVSLMDPCPAWLKFELLDRVDGAKREWVTRGAEKSLWGTQLSTTPAGRNCRHLLITEGEKDALSWASYGCMAWQILPVSVPFGAKWKGQEKGKPSPNREWLDRCWPWMQQFEQVFIAMDSDEAGLRSAADLVQEIGPRRCRLVELPEQTEVKA